MTGKDELLTIAEIAVALIGFSGLFFVFRSRDISELEARDLSALALVVATGSLALAFSLVPLPLAYLGLAESTLWRLCGGLFGAALLCSVIVFTRVNRRLLREGHAERTPRLNRTTRITSTVAGGLLVLSACGLGPGGPAMYLAALVACVLLALAFVAFMLVVARRAASR